MTDADVEKIIKQNMNLQMNLACIRADFDQALKKPWVGLTDEEMEEVRKQAVDLFVQEVKTTGKGRNEPIKFGRLVESKLKEKNT